MLHRFRAVLLPFLVLFPLYCATVPAPKEHLGFTPGEDYKLADYSQIVGYFQALDQASDRMRLVEFGKTSHGKPMYLAYISSPQNLARLDRYRDVSRRLALGQPAPEEAKRLSEEGRVVVWIDSGLHASEVAPAQHAPELAYRMLTEESEEARKIRDNVILLQVPVINPDGLDWIVQWYRQNLGTTYELAPLPRLYQKYAGHDNNRDWFMLNLEETRHVSRIFYEEWFPQIIYNQHQSPEFPARIFVPPYAEPLNPNIPAAVIEGTNLIGLAMRERFAREGKTGVLSYHGYDAWWNGGLRTAPYFHNMHGILTETAATAGYATPSQHPLSDFPDRFRNGVPTRESSIYYPRPWLGGTWGVRDAIEYMLTADFAILELAAARSQYFLWKAYALAREQIETGRKGKPYAYVVPAGQWDRSSALEMLRRLKLAGVEVHRAKKAFQADGKSYPEGTYVLPAAQPFRPYLVDLMEPQKYPELRSGTSGPTKRPYDIAGWTLSMQMGVRVERVEDAFQADLELVEALPAAPSRDHRENSSFLTLADLLARNVPVRWDAQGEMLVEGEAPRERFEKAAWELRPPRTALYEPYTANIDAGWTQWFLEQYRIPHTLLHNEEIRKGGLRDRFDAVILADQSATSILHGARAGERTGRERWRGGKAAVQRPEYTGGIGVQGLAELEAFVREGGTLIAFDDATELPVQFFPLPLQSATTSGAGPDSSQAGFYAPGSLLRIDVDRTQPLALGLPEEAIAISTGGKAWEITLLDEFNKGDRQVRTVARYAKSKLLASGWASGERAVLGRAILVEARHGQGRVVLFGFRPQFRGQSFGTFKFLLNTIYLASARVL